MNAMACLALLSAVGFATISAAEAPRVVHVGAVAPDIIGITVQAGRAEYGAQAPYERQAGDEVPEQGHHRAVMRDGQLVGWLVGHEGKIIHTPDRVVGEELDAAWADRPKSYTLRSPDDPDYAEGAAPVAVYRKSKPSDFARHAGWPYLASVRHVLYLQLPTPLRPGRRYTLQFDGGNLEDRAFLYEPSAMRSEAVHVSHLGFRPDDPAKVAFLSCWMGSGSAITYGSGLAFHVLEDESGRSVFSGMVRLSKAADDRTEDAYEKNYSGADVYEMDFTAVSEPGTYRVYVEGIGCSYPFEIGEGAWRNAFTVSARGFYHQRSGIELGPPYTDYERPRCFHPDDGVKVYHSTCPLMDSGNGLNAKGTDQDNFGNLVKGRTDEIVPNAWGGYMDAGDWDRRIQHLNVSRYLLELAGLFPDYFDDLSLNIPESGDG
ncbi:MAG: hypothetical protein KAX19_12095, partial [Candidatus Brocadiae bacterium]|nr:hypothetical protein [Candidatus Brocadiia bacterium]